MIAVPALRLFPPAACAGLAFAAAAFCLLAANAADTAGVQVRDDAGVTLALRAPARRVVSLAPHLTEQLFAVGAGAQVVGVVAYSDFPDSARQLPLVGDSTQLDLERIVALRPDLIVAWHSGNSAPQLDRLAGLGIAVYRSESRELGDIASTLRRLGQLTGNSATANDQARRFETGIAALRGRYAQRSEVRVFYQIWHQPLLTINRTHMISQALLLCGARNVFADLGALTPAVGEEAVLAADPDAIVTAAVPGRAVDDLQRWRKRKGLRAASLGNLLHVNPDTLHRQSHRFVEGATELCQQIDVARDRSRAAPAVKRRG